MCMCRTCKARTCWIRTSWRSMRPVSPPPPRHWAIIPRCITPTPPIRTASRIRTVREEVARVLRGRAINPRWLAGQMRHGFRGAAEIAQTVDNVFAYAALAGVVDDHQFDLLFDATLGDDAVRGFLSGPTNKPPGPSRHASMKPRDGGCGVRGADPGQPADHYRRLVRQACCRTMTDVARIRGWCPGALRPMESGDGLIVRSLRVTGGILRRRDALQRRISRSGRGVGATGRST